MSMTTFAAITLTSAIIAAVAVGAWEAWREPVVVGKLELCKGISSDDEMVQVGDICVDKYEASVWNEHPALHDGNEVQFGIGPGPQDYPWS